MTEFLYTVSIVLFLLAVVWFLILCFDDGIRGSYMFNGSLAGEYAGTIALAIFAVSVFIGAKLEITKIEQAALMDFQDATNNKEITCIKLDAPSFIEFLRFGKVGNKIVISYLDDNENECTNRFYPVPYDKKESTDGQYRVEITDKKAILYIPNKNNKR